MTDEPLDPTLANLDRRLQAAAGSNADGPTLARARGRVRAQMAARAEGGSSWRSRLLVPAAVLVPVAAAAALAVVLLGGRPIGLVPAGTASPTPSAESTPGPVASPPRVGPPGPPPPADFQPLDVSAISEQEFWVLGSTRCAPAGDCAAAVLHTADGGVHFSAVTAPPARVLANTAAPGVSHIRFAGSRDGWAFGPDAWATHDGGAQWTRVMIGGSVSALEPGASAVYALLAGQQCGQPSCATTLLKTSPGADQCTPTDPPGVIKGVPEMTVRGTSVWVMYNGTAAALWASHDGAATFTRFPYPCSPDLGGTLAAVSNSALWGFCATGTLGHPILSTNSGQTFTAPPGRNDFPNSALLTAVSAPVAFIARGANEGIVRTTDDGATWAPIFATGRPDSSVFYVGFTDTSVGYAIERFTDRAGKQMTALWRTTKGGDGWQGVSFGP